VTYRPVHRAPFHGAGRGSSSGRGNGNGIGGGGGGYGYPRGGHPNGGYSRGGGSGRAGHGRGNANLRRIALMRMRARPRKSGMSGMVPLTILLAVMFLFVGSIGGTVLAGGSAAMATLAEMERDLPDVATFEDLEFAQPSNVYDSTGTVRLARFQAERRRVVSFDEIPPLVLDATIATEDRTFWHNEGYDMASIASAGIESLANVRDRGASTITQQLVRARLLPDDVLDPNQTDVYTRKIKEIIQADRLTRAFPGKEGKQRIITSYLNQIYYGHGAYGIAAAAQIYFGIGDLNQLTPAQAAVLAGLPQSPSNYDLFKWAEEDEQGRLVVPIHALPDRPISIPVQRRSFILRNLYDGHGEFTKLSAWELEQALNEPIILEPEEPLVFQAPHFVWNMKQELDRLLIDRASAERGGYTVITTLDWEAQQIAERYITAATIFTQESQEEMDRLISESGLDEDRDWLGFLRGKDIHNGALVALDARTGNILAYVGSAGYYLDDLASEQLNPKFDVVGQGYRQPGSAWKPMVYAAGFDNGTLTPGTLLFDVTTEYGRGSEPWVPRNANLRDHGPVLARDALYYSLNTTAIRALDMVGVDSVTEMAERMQLNFPRGGNMRLPRAGLAGALGTVEVNMLEYATAFAAMGAAGQQVQARTIAEIRDSNGEVVYRAGDPAKRQVMSEEAAWLVNDILKDNTDPSINRMFGPGAQIVNGPDGERREAAVKTGTTNELRDLSAYGYLAPPAEPDAPHLMVGVWMGNSDNSPPTGGDQPAYAATGPGRVWRAFMREYSRGMPLASFPEAPAGLVSAEIDAWAGGATGPYSTDVLDEWFVAGTEPGGENEVDPAGLLYTPMCDTWYIDPTQLYPDAPQRWRDAIADWTERAREGAGVRGEHGTATAYLPGRDSWGREVVPLICPAPEPTPSPDPGASPDPQPQPTDDPGPSPTDDPGPRPTDRPQPTPPPQPEPTPPPTPDPTPPPPDETEPPDGEGRGGGGGQIPPPPENG
jgi:membrane peptidoglycan carboxypeptidase